MTTSQKPTVSLFYLLSGFLILSMISVSSFAQYGIYLLDPGYLAKYDIQSVTVYKQFERQRLPVRLYDYNAKTKIMEVTYYESPDNMEEYMETLQLNGKGNFTLINPESGEIIGAPYEYKIVDHFLYDYFPEWEYSTAYDSKKRIIHDTIACVDPEDDYVYRYLRYDFEYNGSDLSNVYYWKYDLLGFPNDIQLTTFDWSEDHLRLEAYTRPIDHDDLVADLNRIIPYTLVYTFSKKGMLTSYETESDGDQEVYQFEYRFK